ncbi:hypothetical protein LIER_09446 [Lithospermum erythrorhizon]|uniref:Reverse transcriptase Ty1/copia-type domain-containing protein n=1 Tax=Lithospermum erythrorhizon TaxID=34254 RepID=A0AAV3PFT6_LITER
MLLHGDLHETVYMYQPAGFRDPVHPDYVCKLRKSLYGLKQAPRAWSIMSSLNAEFAMTDLGCLNYFLSIVVTHHTGGLFLSQKQYVEAIVARAGMASCNPTSTPIDTKSKLSSTSGTPLEDPSLFRSLAGALQYLTFTRLDISYAIGQVALIRENPSLVFVFSSVTILSPSLPNNRLLYPGRVLKLSIVGWPMSSPKLVGYATYYWNFIIPCKKLLLCIVAISVLSTCLRIQFSTSGRSTLSIRPPPATTVGVY